MDAQNALHGIDYAIIALYFLAMIGIGIWSVRMAKSREDYLVAGRRLGFPMFFGVWRPSRSAAP